MEEMEFTVLRLDGDYAILSAEESDAQIPMARALLPEESQRAHAFCMRISHTAFCLDQ